MSTPNEKSNDWLDHLQPLGSPSEGGSDSEGGGSGTYEPLGQVVARILREAIYSGVLRQGTRIGQEAVAERLGTSRIPVREALRQLETEGLVTLVPHSGARVARFDLDELLEIYRIREVLEPLALQQSATRRTDEQLEELRALDAEMQATSDVNQLLDLDRRFHMASFAAADMPRLFQLIEGFFQRTQHYRRAHFQLFSPEQLRLIHAEHALLVEALENRDPADAAARQWAHVHRTRAGLSERKELFHGE